MKTYKECEVLDLGGSDIASLIVVGTKSWSDYRQEQQSNENAEIVKIQMIHFGGDGFYKAYLVEYSMVEIGEHYEKVFECYSWLKIYDDYKCVFESLRFNPNFNKFEIYRAGNYGMIIRCLKEE